MTDRKNRYENMMRQNEERITELMNITKERFLTQKEHSEYLKCLGYIRALKMMIARVEEEEG